ncbi:MAG: hypothetical protein WBL25_06040 [Anaerolineales bacterium]
MQYDEEPWDEDTEIDPELWLQALLAMTADRKGKEKLVRDISEKTGLVPEQVELIISQTIEFMANKTRSN